MRVVVTLTSITIERRKCRKNRRVYTKWNRQTGLYLREPGKVLSKV